MFKMNYIYGEQTLDKGTLANESVNMELEGGGGLTVTNTDCMATNQCNKYYLVYWQCIMFLGEVHDAVCYTQFLFIRLVYDKHELFFVLTQSQWICVRSYLFNRTTKMLCLFI